jgi:hypothetical protein
MIVGDVKSAIAANSSARESVAGSWREGSRLNEAAS